ncbi:hypothetical protein QZH41_007977 [Actinostola sp. cb2023]|nr:hypothetical protein QZH41_007977 [Actinostola sp. cb2023]
MVFVAMALKDKRYHRQDDGAPETSQLTMSIGSMTLWNLGDRVRSRDYQYLIHCVSLQEKHQVLEDLWIQHTDEMSLLEGNIITINGKECTVEFQPSADMSWQSWANHEVNQAATHPSPFANVSKSNIVTMGGSIGCSNEDTWKPYTNDVREKHAKQVQKFTQSLPSTQGVKGKHDKTLKYMAENGIRQLGYPRIGIFAERQRQEPMHCEINSWQHLLHLIYLEFVQRGMFNEFIDILRAPAGKCEPTESTENSVAGTDDPPLRQGKTADARKNNASSNYDIGVGGRVLELDVTVQPNDRLLQHMEITRDKLKTTDTTRRGCGLGYLVHFIKEHYADEKKRYNQLPSRLIGDQAISLARRKRQSTQG